MILKEAKLLREQYLSEAIGQPLNGDSILITDVFVAPIGMCDAMYTLMTENKISNDDALALMDAVEYQVCVVSAMSDFGRIHMFSTLREWLDRQTLK